MVQECWVNEVQDIYRLQGVKINAMHFEVIVRQRMSKVIVSGHRDTRMLEKQTVSKVEFSRVNDEMYGQMVVVDAGESAIFKEGQIVSARILRDENSLLKRNDKKTVSARESQAATSYPLLQGITIASLQTEGFISAASFQETTKVLNEAAVNGKVDDLLGLK